MYGNFVGIDISGNTAKAVLIKRGFREEKLLKTLLTDFSIDDEASLSRFNSLLNEKFAPQNSQIIVGISSTPFSQRVLEFPFSDAKKVDNVYKFEIDNISTFKTDDKHMNYHLTKVDGSGEALVSIFDKGLFQKYLSHLKAGGLDPKYVVFTPYAFDSINDLIPEERPILLISMDSQHLNFSLLDENGLRRVRNSNGVIDGIKNSLQLDSLDFETINNDPVLKNKFLDNTNELVDEIRRTTHYFETEIKRTVKSFLIAGEVCNVSDVEEVLGQKAGCQISKLFIPELGTKDSAIFSNAYSLAKYGSSFNSGKFNLRTGDYKYSGKNYDLRKMFPLPLALAAILLLLLIVKNTTGSLSTRGQIRSLNSQIQKEVKASFPNVSTIADPVGFLKKELGKVQKKLDVVREVKGGLAPLDILRDLSISTPQDIEFSVDEVRFESNKRVKIWGNCHYYKEIAAIEKALIDSGKYDKVEREQVNRSVKNRVKFVLSLVVK